MILTVKNLDAPLKIENVYCVTRNYVDHAKELNNPVPKEPVIFMKSTSCLSKSGIPIFSPSEDSLIHYEGELVVAIGFDCGRIGEKIAEKVILGYAVGIDFTLRNLQNQAKSQGLPWTFSKNFTDSAPLSDLVLKEEIDLTGKRIKLSVNGELRQDGDISNMIFSIPYLISFISHHFPLRRGDLIFTGTPSGVFAVKPGDEVLCWVDGIGEIKTNVRSYQ